jgi:hypothetical protein
MNDKFYFRGHGQSSTMSINRRKEAPRNGMKRREHRGNAIMVGTAPEQLRLNLMKRSEEAQSELNVRSMTKTVVLGW